MITPEKPGKDKPQQYVLLNSKLKRIIGIMVKATADGVNPGPPIFQPKTIMPGLNQIPVELYEEFKKAAVFVYYTKKKKEIELVEGSKSSTPIRELSPDDVADVIKECFDIELLNRFLSEENRREVKKTIREQIKYLEGVFAKPGSSEQAA